MPWRHRLFSSVPTMEFTNSFSKPAEEAFPSGGRAAGADLPRPHPSTSPIVTINPSANLNGPPQPGQWNQGAGENMHSLLFWIWDNSTFFSCFCATFAIREF
jgi:hypothetical protein